MFTPSSSAVSAFVVKFLYPFSHVVSSWCRLACLKSCPSQYSALLCYLIPAPALFAGSLMTSFPPRHSRCSPHPPRLRPANWLIVCCLCRSTLGGAFLPWTDCVWVYLLQRWAALPPNHTSFLLGSLRWLRCWCRSPHTHWWDRQLTKTLTKQLDMSWIINTKYWCWYMENPSSH